MAPAGTPDVVGYSGHGTFIGLEVKLPGQKPTTRQLEAGRAILTAGGIWAVVTSVREAVDAVRASK
jgi:protein involved in polysaccharide export with SLBB domain